MRESIQLVLVVAVAFTCLGITVWSAWAEVYFLTVVFGLLALSALMLCFARVVHMRFDDPPPPP